MQGRAKLIWCLFAEQGPFSSECYGWNTIMPIHNMTRIIRCTKIVLIWYTLCMHVCVCVNEYMFAYLCANIYIWLHTCVCVSVC